MRVGDKRTIGKLRFCGARGQAMRLNEPRIIAPIGKIELAECGIDAVVQSSRIPAKIKTHTVF